MDVFVVAMELLIFLNLFITNLWTAFVSKRSNSFSIYIHTHIFSFYSFLSLITTEKNKKYKEKLKLIAIEWISSKNPFFTIIIRFFNNSHLNINIIIQIINFFCFEIFTVKKSTFRITFANVSGRNLPPHNFRVHVSNVGACAK